MTKERETMNNSNFSYEIKERLGVLNSNRGFTTEVNIISYNGATPKVDIRKWDRRTDKMLKGITLTTEEAQALKDTLSKPVKTCQKQSKKREDKRQ